ncbi:MarR family transcriptional regulator [Actinospica durhamensis]|uniref:MarR family transcriptional regulator n=1 Tax=Actinospica durhamensis TaxID=1508375 RepID=A0A941EYM8_9ACTN|nr:MarR family transcriptional regulator [Actinospica durhamensis]MBR7839556.1 MarR family transcriptional regulator [Actinospica durhamensis]
MDEVEVRTLQSHLGKLHKRLARGLPPLDGVSRSATRVLSAAVASAGTEEGAQPGRIAEAIGMTTSNVAAALRELEQEGYVARRRAPDDGRRIAVVLTERGKHALAAHRALRAHGLREAIEAVLTTDEQAQLTAVIPLIGRVSAALEGAE